MPTSGNAIRAGRAFVELFAEDSKLVAAFARAQKRMAAFAAGAEALGSHLLTFGGGTAAALIATTKVFGEMGEQLSNMSERTGVSADTLSELGYAAAVSGANLETVNDALQVMAKNIVSAGLGSKKAVMALELLGLTFADVKDLSPEEQFKLIADRLAAIHNPTLKAAAAMRIFGGAGTQLLPMLADGAAGLDALQKRARDLHLTISPSQAKAAREINDAMDELWRTFNRLIFAVGEALAPAIKDVVGQLTRGASAAIEWVGDNKQLVVLAMEGAVAIAGMGAALIGTGFALKGVALALGIATSSITLFGGALSAALTLVGALLTPIGLLSATVVSLGAYLVYESGVGAKAIRTLGQTFMDLKTVGMEAATGIVDALKSGDIELAAQIMWTGLKLAWIQGVTDLKLIWQELENAWDQMTLDMGAKWNFLINDLEYAWNGFKGWLHEDVKSSWWKYLFGAAPDVLDKALGGDDPNYMKNLQTDHAANDERLKGLIGTYNQMSKEQQQSGNDKLDAIKNESLQAATELRMMLRRLVQDASIEAHAVTGDAALNALQDNIALGHPTPAFDFDRARMQAQNIESRGTFNPVEAASTFGAGGPWDRLLKAAEKTAQNTADLVDQMGDSDDTWAD